jgi:hypothetical protein
MSILRSFPPRKIETFPSSDEEIIFDYKDGGQISSTSYGPINGQEHLLIIYNKNFNTLSFYVLANQDNHQFLQTDYFVYKQIIITDIFSIKKILDDYKKTLIKGGGYLMGKVRSIIDQIIQLIELNEFHYMNIKNNKIKMQKIIDSKTKLIEELKKKCKTSISNSLPRTSKKIFKPTLNTIPNTKTRNSKSMKFAKSSL